ncbi:MAG: VanZ family protein [Planctomycetota bacterium]
MLAIFIFSSTHGEEAPLRDTSVLNVKITNILHVPVFTLLFLLWIWALKGVQKNYYLYAFAISILYGVFIEIYQAFVPGRCSSLLDIILNTSGVGIGIIFTRWGVEKGIL